MNHQIPTPNQQILSLFAIFIPFAQYAGGLLVASHEHFPTHSPRVHSSVSKTAFRAGLWQGDYIENTMFMGGSFKKTMMGWSIEISDISII